MARRKRRRFSPEFKEQTVAHLSEHGAGYASVAAEHGATATQLKTWSSSSTLRLQRRRLRLRKPRQPIGR